MADVELSPEAAVVASKIRTIDRELDQIEKDRDESIVRGMRAPSGAAVTNKWGQDRADTRREALLRERAELASQLRKLVGGSASRVGHVRGVSDDVRLLVSPLSPSAEPVSGSKVGSRSTVVAVWLWAMRHWSDFPGRA